MLDFFSNYGYGKELIESSIDRLRAYGLIDSNLNEQLLHQDRMNKEAINENTKPLIELKEEGDKYISFEIHEKGVYALELFTKNIDFIYHSCLGSYIPVNLLESKIFVHSNNLNDNKSFYPIKSVKTSIFFIKYLISIDKEQINLVLKNTEAKYNNLKKKEYSNIIISHPLKI